MYPHTPRKRILVVEDEPDMQIFLSTVLKTGGFEPTLAHSGAEGIRKAKEQIPALIVLDIMMPKEQGIQMYGRLRQDKTLRKIPVIVLSTLEKKTFLHYRSLQGFTPDQDDWQPRAYLAKPPEADELLMQVRQWTGSGGMQGGQRRSSAGQEPLAGKDQGP